MKSAPLCMCSKEKEIGEMATDIKWIRKALEGNGTVGLIRQVEQNTAWRYRMMGGIGLLTIIMGWAMLIIIKRI